MAASGPGGESEREAEREGGRAHQYDGRTMNDSCAAAFAVQMIQMWPNDGLAWMLWFSLVCSLPLLPHRVLPAFLLGSFASNAAALLFVFRAARRAKQSFKVAASFQTLKLSRMLYAQETAKGGYHFLSSSSTHNRSTGLSYKRMARCRFNLRRVLFYLHTRLRLSPTMSAAIFAKGKRPRYQGKTV